MDGDICKSTISIDGLVVVENVVFLDKAMTRVGPVLTGYAWGNVNRVKKRNQ
jgi:hypothetical protein